jgi:hypothetical protein
VKEETFREERSHQGLLFPDGAELELEKRRRFRWSRGVRTHKAYPESKVEEEDGIGK